MSVLSFPRVYFNGWMQWDVPTGNNNDYLPVYASAEAGLDWDFLGKQHPPITSENFREYFRAWAIEPHEDSCPAITSANPSDSCHNDPDSHMPSRWNYYGGAGSQFVQYDAYRSLCVGGDIAYGQAAAADDPLLGLPVSISGNSFGGHPSAARLVDINPKSPFCSQIFLAGLKIGDDDTYIGGAPITRMYSQFFTAPRNISGALIIAGAIGTVFQTAVPRDKIESSNKGNSPLLEALLKAMRESNAAGLMMQFSAYNTLYYQNGVFNDTTEQPRNCSEVSALYRQGKVFSQPAYSRVAGSLGVWLNGEAATAPNGHMLVPYAKATPVGGEAGSQAPPAPLTLGTLWGEVNADAACLSLNLVNAIPEYTLNGDKFDYGTISAGVLPDDGGEFKTIGNFDFQSYNKAAYESRGGIVDVPFADGVTIEDVREWIAAGNLALQVDGKTICLERPLVARTDSRGVYIDQCRTATFSVQVRYKNALPPAGTKLRFAQYYPFPLALGSGSMALFGASAPSDEGDAVCATVPDKPYVDFPDGDIVEVDAKGEATVRLAANDAGFPMLVYYPFTGGTTPPCPQDQLIFGFEDYAKIAIGNASFSAIRVMPFDNDLLNQFVDRWNGTGSYAGQPKYDRQLTWLFIYGKILYVYDMLYPVMDQFMPMGNLDRVEGAIDQLLMMIQEDWVDGSTLYMPVTRELSAAKRLILQTWGDLVVRKYPQEPIAPLSVPCDITSD